MWKTNDFIKNKAVILAATLLMIFLAAKLTAFYTAATFPIVAFIFATCVSIFQFYKVTMIKRLNLIKFKRRGLIYNLLSKRVFLYVFWALFSLAFSMVALVKMFGFSPKEWLALSVALPVFYALFRVSKQGMQKELNEEFVNIYALRFTVALTSLIMIVVFPAVLYVLGEYRFSFSTLDQAVNARAGAYAGLISCPIAYVIADKVALFDGVVAYGLSLLSGKYLLLAIPILVAEGFVFLIIMSVFALCSLPGKEVAKSFLPFSDGKDGKKDAQNAVFMVSFLFSFVLLFVYLPLVINVNNWLSHNEEVFDYLDLPRKTVVEVIDGYRVRQGAIAKLKDLEISLIRQARDMSDRKIEMGIDKAHDMMIANVDGFLDWYYSLTAEYLRLGNMMTGDIDDYMESKLTEHIQKNNPSRHIAEMMDQMLRENEALMAQFKTASQKIIEEHRVREDDVQSYDIHAFHQPFKALAQHEDFIDLKVRAASASGGGILAGSYISTKIVAKIMSKSSVKLAAKTIAKLVGEKVVGSAAGAGAGAAVGGTIGSIFPGLGTAIGAAIGGAVGGISAGLALDKAFLEIEEIVNRKEFKKEIVAAINESREEVKNELMLRRRDPYTHRSGL